MSHVDNSDSTVEEILDYHAQLIRQYLADDVSQIYLGDVINYPPIAFQNRLGEQRLVVSIIVDDMIPQQLDQAGGVWDLRVSIVAIANMVPEFRAMPEEAFAERRIIRFISRYSQLLSKTENSTLQGRVTASSVNGVEFDYMKREELALRGAAIQWSAKVYIDNTW
jgi:hypothetical protein